MHCEQTALNKHVEFLNIYKDIQYLGSADN